MPEKDKSNPTNFGDPDAIAAVAAAKAKRVPLGGVPMPAMPRLDQPPPSTSAGVQSVRSAQRVLTPQEQARLAEQGKLVTGVGSAYAVNQPGIAGLPTDTEGNEQPIDPKLQPRPPGAGLRQETVEQLAAVAAANSDDTELKKIEAEIEGVDDVFETNEFGERVRSLLANKKRKEIIEGRCKPLAFEELLMNGYVHQEVPIIPGKFVPIFRSLSGEDNEEILRLMNSVRGPDQYILDVMSLYNLTAGLYAINGKPLVSHINSNGDFAEEMFRAKNKIIRKMSIAILADLSVNFRWFTQRVQKLTVVDDIKGF